MADYEDAAYDPYYANGEMPEDEEEDTRIQMVDCFNVISSYFDSKGLVSQQIESFNNFMRSTMQELIDEHGGVALDQMVPANDMDANPIIVKRHEVKFGKISLSSPSITEGDGTTSDLMPNEARLRNLTYSSAVYLSMQKKLHTARERPDAGSDEAGVVDAQGKELYWTTEELGEDGRPQDIFLGKVPIMLKSSTCHLVNSDRFQTEKDLFAWGECPYDQGGYFIINGSEKVLIAQERSAGNIVQVFKKAAPSPVRYMAEIRSSIETGSRMLSQCSVKLMAAGEGGVRSGIVNPIRIQLPYIRQDIPMVIVFRALGVISDSEILEKICFDQNDREMMEMLMGSLQEGSLIQGQQLALDFIGRRGQNPNLKGEDRRRHALDILQKELLPHIGQSAVESNELRKAFFLGYMINRMLKCALGRTEPDDRDHMGKKRLDLAGPLMANLFRVQFQKVVKDLYRYMQRQVEADRDIVLKVGLKSNIITNGLKYSLATGNWGDQKKVQKAKAGVSQVLSRYTFASTLSHLRRTNAPIGRDGKIAKPRQLHNTHWGYICPAETPEGQACGLVKNLALMSTVTTGTVSQPVLEYIMEKNVEPLEDWEPRLSPTATKIFLNGVWFAVIKDDPKFLVDNFRRLRRRGMVDWQMSLVWDIRDKEFRINMDAGRIIRPLFVVETDPSSAMNGHLILTKDHLRRLDNTRAFKSQDPPLPEDEWPEPYFGWNQLVEEGIVEYLDAEEEETAMISMTPTDLDNSRAVHSGWTLEPSEDPLHRVEPLLNKNSHTFTHCEIHPSMILGICASIIPFPDHNQSPRNTYQSAMGKQAMGVFLTNFDQRMETMANILYYPQKPLATTASMEYLKFRELPAGQNAIVAISCYSGYNQEDSVIMNQSSIDRGLFRSLYYRTYQDQEKMVGHSVVEMFERPSRADTLRIKNNSTYDKIDDDGIVAPGVRVSGDDIIMGKTAPMAPDAEELGQRTKQHVKRDVSTPLRSTENGIVDQVMMTTTGEGTRFAKVRVRTTKVPQVGDKFASRHGQKGTIGVTYRQEDMPFTREGIVPDLIVNPHAIPSRMTIAHLIECQLSKVATLRGFEGDATPFSQVTVTNISTSLRALGYQSRGFEVMYNGHTGRKLMAQVFFGPTYYQRLRHMVDDKIHSRARGPTQILTRQPVEGRARDGGLRFGEMERDCMIAHGASSFLKERLFDVSDPFRVHVCDICGLMTPVA